MTKLNLVPPTASLLALLVSGCGGGGGSPQSTPTPSTRTSVTIPPVTGGVSTSSGVSMSASDPEYTLSNAASTSKAIGAYNAGVTGAGVTLAIVDSGLTDAISSFTGRISSASTDIVSNRGYADGDITPDASNNNIVTSHGTAVASVAAAAHDGVQTLGVAFDATVMALRTDTVGTCASSTGCSFNDNDIAHAVTYAQSHGAKIINISLGGSDPASASLVSAINNATAAGIIIVIASGNDGTANPDKFAQVAADAAAHGLVIIAGAQTASGSMASYSNKAGSFGQYYLTALGDHVNAVNSIGMLLSYSGTSFAAPTISGAVALLEQAFPTLTPAQIVNLLMATATDAGTSGTDSTFGRGLLNLTAAFAPQGATTMAGSVTQISLTNNATLGSAMGDASASNGALGHVAFLDGLGRAYTMNLGSTIQHIGQRRPLFGSIGTGFRSAASNFGGRLSVSMSVSQDNGFTNRLGFEQNGTTAHPERAIVPLASTMKLALGKNTQATLGFSSGALSPLVREGGSNASFLIAQTPALSPGFDTTDEMTLGLRHQFGRVTLGFDSTRGKALGALNDDRRPDFTIMRVSAAGHVGPLDLGLGLGQMRESGTVLGSRFGAALGGGGAVTRLMDIDLGLALGGGWRTGASFRQGWTSAHTGGALVDGQLQSNAFAWDLGWTGQSSRFGLRIAQPLRVSSGGYNLKLPTAYDYATLTTSYDMTRLNLAPQGHELDLETGYGFALGSGWFDTNLYMRREPGNIAIASTDVGAAMRFTVGW